MMTVERCKRCGQEIHSARAKLPLKYGPYHLACSTCTVCTEMVSGDRVTLASTPPPLAIVCNFCLMTRHTDAPPPRPAIDPFTSPRARAALQSIRSLSAAPAPSYELPIPSLRGSADHLQVSVALHRWKPASLAPLGTPARAHHREVEILTDKCRAYEKEIAELRQRAQPESSL